MDEIFKIIGICLSLLGFIYTYFGLYLKMKEDMLHLSNQITDQKVKTDLFWKTVENTMIDHLKSADKERKDTLLDKFKERSLTITEAESLRTILNEEKLELLPEQQMSFALIMGRIEELLFDLRKNEKS